MGIYEMIGYEEHVASTPRVEKYAKQETDMKHSLLPVPPKHRLTFNRLHGVISQEILFITISVRTSIPTNGKQICRGWNRLAFHFKPINMVRLDIERLRRR
jgi:hypothetical protein